MDVEELSHLQSNRRSWSRNQSFWPKRLGNGGCLLELYRTSLPDDTLVLDVLHAQLPAKGLSCAHPVSARM
jgi:hypothetical protein